MFFLRQFYEILSLPIIVILLILCYPKISLFHTTQSNFNLLNTNSDATVALLNPNELQTNNFNHVLYVISLDGKITAIDVRQKGRQLWTSHTGSSLIDSSLSKFEIIRNSKSIRLIPSLVGGIYEKHDHTEHIEPLPFDAESLLNTTFHFHDELIMTGGKDIDTLGLDLTTGKIIYRFSKHYVDQSTSKNDACSTSMLIIKRIKQTVRARNVRNGYEKWNFSVSNYELLYLYSHLQDDIFERSYPKNDLIVFFEYELQSGVIFAFDKKNDLIWTSSIKNPIAAVWELKNGQLKEKSLFKTKRSRRLAFMGEYNSTPYVLISSRIQQQLIHHARKHTGTSASGMKRAISSSKHETYLQRHLTMNSESSKNDQKYPLIVRQNDLWDMKGYLELIHPMENIFDEEKSDRLSDVQLKPTWNICRILLCICLMVITIIFIRHTKRKQQPPTHLMVPEAIDVTSECQLASTEPFQSRYLLEYEHIGFLGRGGFGMVFEAINKLDQRRVAIKRVSLKKSLSKERVLKEIRCMAVLNHPNLIQYYYAWDECPPNEWQDEIDMKTEITKDSLSVFSTESAVQRQTVELPQMIDFTFERSLNPPQIHENSHSSLFEHSYDSSNEESFDDKSATDQSIKEDNSNHLTIYFYFVMELCQCESLRDRLIKKSINQLEAWSIFDQIIQGIEYIHSQKLIHRDLKPSNILFSINNTVKIGDFGLVSAFGEDKIENIDQNGNNELGGTILYMSPEQINRQSYNQKVDIYAIGIILFELMYPFSTQMERVHILTKIRFQSPIFPINFESNQIMCQLIRWLLSNSPHDRPRACEFRQNQQYQNILKEENLFV
ncbi:hypothetical protein I4U23_013267 [Adineta vaga]|nr:hypothetical protein I4U23_013267 [Adineta vaga]